MVKTKFLDKIQVKNTLKTSKTYKNLFKYD